MGNYTIFLKFENPRRGRQARNLSENDPKILDLKSSSEQIIFRKLSLGAPESFRMVSLPVSFLSLACASTVDYEVLHSDGHFRVKDKVLIFSTDLFILSIRLFADTLFTVSYKWWVTTQGHPTRLQFKTT